MKFILLTQGNLPLVQTCPGGRCPPGAALAQSLFAMKEGKKGADTSPALPLLVLYPCNYRTGRRFAFFFLSLFFLVRYLNSPGSQVEGEKLFLL